MLTTGPLALVVLIAAASPLVLSKSATLWTQRVFPDDEQWMTPYRKQHREDVTKEINIEKYDVCKTKECKIIATEFLSSMNKSANPCEDFYEFTCGAWSAKDVIPPSAPAWSRFMMFQNVAHQRIKAALETPLKHSDILPVRKAKKWYRSCMDTDTLEQRGINPIETILMQAGGWPISMDEEEWNPEEYTWQKVERHYARLMGSYAFSNIEVHASEVDPEKSFLEVGSPEMTLSEHFPIKYRNYTGNDYDAYVRLVEGAAELFAQHNHASVSREKLTKEAKEIVEFEKKLYELKGQDSRYEETTLEKFVEWYETNNTEANADHKSKIDWKFVIQGLFDMVNIKIDASTGVFLSDVAYFEGIGDLLKKTPARTIVNYVHWTFVGNMLMFTNEFLRDELLAYAKAEYGITERPPRWSECVSDMSMAHAAAYVFVNEYFNKSTETAAREMIKNVQNEMGDKIEKSNWLDEESKKITKDKLDSMKIFIGFPDWYKNKTAVTNYYKGLTVGADYFDNVLSFRRYQKKKALRRFSQTTQEEDPWHINPTTVNALYGPLENSLNLPAVDFQAPLFTPKLPNAVNYGVGGVVIGHEMGHGFDDTGIEFGKDGDETSLSRKILKSYFQRAECFTDQFDHYYREIEESESTGISTASEPSKPKMAIVTRGENIADTTGVQAVFQAYQKATEKESHLRLPGLEEFTSDQLFFMSFAAIWCEVERPEYTARSKESPPDAHSPGRLRVIGSVSNTKDFASAFNCPKGSPMNPTNKCNVWEKSESTSKMGAGSPRRKNHWWETQWKS